MAKLAINGATPVRTTPFPVWPIWGEEEIQKLTEVVKSRQWACLNGTQVKSFEERYAEYQQAKHGICVTSGTTALRIALNAAGIQPGQEVIVPGYTFIATATAVVENGGIPVFVDIDPTTYNIDLKAIEAAITPNTGAIMPVHFAGRPCDMDSINSIAKKHNLVVIEDAAQAWGSEWDGTRVGAMGDAGTFSFYQSKNVNSGEGGIIVTNDDTIEKFARSFANCGRSDDGLWYEHFYFGTNARMTEFQAAVLHAQMDRYDELQAIRQENVNFLNENFSSINGLDILTDDPKVTSHSQHIYIFKYKKDKFDGISKDNVIAALRAEGIPCSPGYSLPLHKQPVFLNKAFGPQGKQVDIAIDYDSVSLPETDKAVYDEAIWFGQNALLGTNEDMQDIVNAVSKVVENISELKGKEG